MKKFLTLFVMILTIFTIVGCNDPKPTIETLGTPQNVVLSETGVLSWDPVSNATSYDVTINGKVTNVKTPFYIVTDLTKDFTYSIVAKAEGFNPSIATEVLTYKAPTITPPKPPVNNIKIGISGTSEVRSGKSVTLKANVTGTENVEVTWAITKGQEYAVIDENGVVSAIELAQNDGDKLIEVTATSVEDSTVYASKILTVVNRPELTQAMIDAIANEVYLSFEGYLNISLYPVLASENAAPEQTYSTVIKTAMCTNENGEDYWYGEYENGDTYTTMGLYYKNHNGITCQVGLSLMNVEQYEPLLDDYGNPINWDEYGLYNNFTNLKVSDFMFNNDTWRWEYVGSDSDLDDRMIASANPYDFKTRGFSLIIEEGEIMGIYAKSDYDYTIVEQYKAIQELYVAVNYGEKTVVVPTIPTYTYDEEVHGTLKEALENMNNLENYTLTYKEIVASYLSTGYTEAGFKELITENDCYFEPFAVSYNIYGEEVHTPKPLETYGYHKFSDNLYNAYFNTDTGYKASRAFESSFDNAKPSFAFAPEIFRSYYVDEENNTTTYYVEEIMSYVATTFYYGVGNDINLYGIFATTGYTSETSSFTPYVVVDNETKYITEAGFYFYLGSIYGVIELYYSDFNETSMPSDINIEFEQRNVPTSWKELTIQKSLVEGGIEDDVEVNAFEYLKEFYEVENTEEAEKEFEELMPFFGNVLGDSYGFGLTTFHITSKNVSKQAVAFYYDVPLDLDYTIDSSLEAIEEYLVGLGFVENGAGEFHKDGIWVAPVDSSLDLFIYIWKD